MSMDVGMSIRLVGRDIVIGEFPLSGGEEVKLQAFPFDNVFEALAYAEKQLRETPYEGVSISGFSDI